MLGAAILLTMISPFAGRAEALNMTLETQDAFDAAANIEGNVEWSGSDNQLTIGAADGSGPNGNYVSAGTGNTNFLAIQGGTLYAGRGASAVQSGTTLYGNQILMNGGGGNMAVWRIQPEL